MFRGYHFCLPLPALLALSSCQPAYYVPPQPPYCEELVTELSGLDEAGATGVRANDFLPRVTGPRASVLEYLPPTEDGSVYVEIEREADMTALDIELMPDTGSLRWVDSELVVPEGSEHLEPPRCLSRLELDTRVSVSSEDGVFAESFDTVMAGVVDEDGALDYVAVPIPFHPDDLSGSFEVLSVEPSAPGPSFLYFEMWMEFPLSEGDPAAPVEPKGYVGGIAEYNYIDYILFGVFTIATYGEYELDDQLPGGLLEPVEGATQEQGERRAPRWLPLGLSR